jgi:hypothetical protein
MWLGLFEEGVKNMGVMSWRSNSRDRREWRTILKEAKVQRGGGEGGGGEEEGIKLNLHLCL